MTSYRILKEVKISSIPWFGSICFTRTYWHSLLIYADVEVFSRIFLYIPYLFFNFALFIYSRILLWIWRTSGSFERGVTDNLQISSLIPILLESGSSWLGPVSQFRVGFFNHSMRARNRVGIGLSYRPARLHRLAEMIPWNRFLTKFGLSVKCLWRERYFACQASETFRAYLTSWAYFSACCLRCGFTLSLDEIWPSVDEI